MIIWPAGCERNGRHTSSMLQAMVHAAKVHRLGNRSGHQKTNTIVASPLMVRLASAVDLPLAVENGPCGRARESHPARRRPIACDASRSLGSLGPLSETLAHHRSSCRVAIPALGQNRVEGF